ncbi:LEA type 2 family protein [Azohydromonas sediminis]|uniref:LEA type 2 family protein n=1 Tax=Azohydromonas sediminis TaxID=2259674 RepID=UPI000E65643A|nr:LEA type 2 family protein [Azohydromonas sediminis]
MDRRSWCRRSMAAVAAFALAGLGGCAGVLGREPLRVNLVGVEPLPGEGLEMRLAVKLRVQNPNEVPLEFQGVSLDLDVGGQSFAFGVSPERGQVPAFGETVLMVPASVSAWAVVRQVIGLASGERRRFDVRLRGRMHGPGIGGAPFESTAEIELPASLLGR